jgi:hypothetical protein
MLARRSISDPTDLAFYRCYATRAVTPPELVRVAGSRWSVEEVFQATKNEVGLDHYQVRKHTAWYRHVTLAMVAHAHLAFLAADPPDTCGDEFGEEHDGLATPHDTPNPLVTLATPPPSPRPPLPLPPPATPHRSLNAAGVLVRCFAGLAGSCGMRHGRRRLSLRTSAPYRTSD